MGYRKFWLTNSKNTRFELTDLSVKNFFNAPSGLGFTDTLTFVRYGEKTNVNSDSYNMPSVSGTITFWDKANSSRYKQYNDFVRFTMEKPLQLHYEIPLSTPAEYVLDCYVTNIQKTESTVQGIMDCSVTFQGLSFWKGATVTQTGTSTSYVVTNGGDCPVGFEIDIQGSLANPFITLEQDNELYGECKFDDLTSFDEVYVNSKDGEQNVVLKQGGYILANPLSYQDLSISNGAIYVTFCKLARGTSTLTVGYDSGSLTSVDISFAPIYRSV